jgi:hypothetical protein
MRFISRGALAAFTAALALSVVAVASASAALPEFVPAAGGKFPITASGSVTTGGGNTIRFELGRTINIFDCKSAKFNDEITAAKSVSLTTDLEGCDIEERSYEGHECTSTGAPTGVIVLSGKGSLVYLEKATKKAGVLLPVGEVKVSCDHGAEKYTIEGSVLSPITPVNSEITKYELRYAEQKYGVEEYTSYENESGKKVNTEFFAESTRFGEQELALGITPKIQLTANKAFTISA